MTQPDTESMSNDPLAPARVVLKQVKAALEEQGPLLGFELGTATLKGGAEVPAIYLADWPEGTVVKGLEVIVPRSPRIKPPPGFKFLGFERTWLVRFINNDSDPDILEKAAQALAERFWPFAVDPALLEESPETCEQMVIGLNLDQLTQPQP